MAEYYQKYAQGPAKPITDDEGNIIDDIAYKLDTWGITNPNLHRRTDVKEPVTPLVKPTVYEFGTYNLNSYRFKNEITHDEESTISEIP